MSKKESLYPLPQGLSKYLAENGYQETEPGCFELIKPGAHFPDCRMTIVGKESEVEFTASHDPSPYNTVEEGGRIITWKPRKRAICYAIKREFFAEPGWKWYLNDALQNMALALFLPFFNLHTPDQNTHLRMKP